MTHISPKRNMVPKALLMRSSLVSLTTARLVNTAQPRTTVNSARPMTNVFNKAHSIVRRPINNKTLKRMAAIGIIREVFVKLLLDSFGKLSIRWMKRKGVGTQKESQICCGQFISKISRKSRGILIPEDLQLGVPRVGAPRPPRASMQDLYNRMGRMEIRQAAILELDGTYNPLGYAQPQYDQYYQQYPAPLPPQQQQDDDDE
ncbi:hypothetical protein Tco_0322488 [Tanacetum coccineum]